MSLGLGRKLCRELDRAHTSCALLRAPPPARTARTARTAAKQNSTCLTAENSKNTRRQENQVTMRSMRSLWFPMPFTSDHPDAADTGKQKSSGKSLPSVVGRDDGALMTGALRGQPRGQADVRFPSPAEPEPKIGGARLLASRLLVWSPGFSRCSVGRPRSLHRNPTRRSGVPGPSPCGSSVGATSL